MQAADWRPRREWLLADLRRRRDDAVGAGGKPDRIEASQVLAAGEADLEDSDYLADLAGAAALDAGVMATEGALQIRGGVGFTWEPSTGRCRSRPVNASRMEPIVASSPTRNPSGSAPPVNSRRS